MVSPKPTQLVLVLIGLLLLILIGELAWPGPSEARAGTGGRGAGQVGLPKSARAGTRPGAAEIPTALAEPGGTGPRERLASAPPERFAPEPQPHSRDDRLVDMQEFLSLADNMVLELREEQLTRTRSQLEKRSKGMDELIRSHDKRLGLSASQSERLRGLLWERIDLERGYLRRWEQGAHALTLGEIKASDAQRQESELAAFLSARQLRLFLARGAGWGG